jgi:hypothetical protein
VFGRRHDVGGRRIDDQDSALGAGIDVDVIETDPGPADDSKAISGIHEL